MAVTNQFNADLAVLATEAQASKASQAPFWDAPIGYTEVPQNQWSPWDIVYVNERPLPGMGRIVIRKKPRIKVQKRKSNGTDGDAPILIGYEPAELSIE